MNDLRVVIDRLILEGIDLPVADQPALLAAVQTELGRLLAEGGLDTSLRAGGAWRGVPAGGIEVGGAPEPEALGRQIAGAVYGGLGG